MARPCSICIHPKREAIESALVGLMPYRTVAAKFGLPPRSVITHKNDHLPAKLAKTSKPTARAVPHHAAPGSAPVEVTEIASADRLIDQVVGLTSRALALLTMVEQGAPPPPPAEPGATSGPAPPPSIDFKAAASLLREGRSCLELQAKMLGQIQSGARVEIHMSPDWAALRAVMISALAPHPAALADLASALDRHFAGHP